MISLRKLRSLTRALAGHAGLYRELIHVEWQEEKARLLNMLLAIFLGFTFLFCLLLSIGALVLLYSWQTPYRTIAVVGLLLFYGVGIAFAVFRFNALANRGYLAFADTREELATDFVLVRNKLEP
jgi:uncharacterized membrane protein YqjE